MDYISMLGKRISEVSLGPLDYLMEYNDRGLDENIEPTWIVKAKDGRYEMILSIDKIIQVIFIVPIREKLDGFDIDPRLGRSHILKTMGTPSKSGQEMTLPILGKKGGFDRYDNDSYSIHFEYFVGGQGIEKITLMLPEVVKNL